jgi:hypothetical protein
MKIYIAKTLSEEEELIRGIQANPHDWENTPLKLVDVTADRDLLLAASNGIDTASAALKEANQLGSERNTNSKNIIKQAENIVYSLYPNNPAKLSEYGMKPRKPGEKVPSPDKTLAINITDDTDGEGFILTLAIKDDVADFYEWKKGQGIDPKDTSTTPPMFPFKNSAKLTFVDDDVLPGIRYFYSVRAVNRNGKGPESEAASRVQ